MNSKLFSIILITFTLFGCGNHNDSSSTNITAIDISPPSPSLPQQNNSLTIQFIATARDSNFNGIPGVTFTWSSSDHNVACMDASGNATAYADGQTTITAKTSGVVGTTLLTVNGVANFPPQPPTVPCL